MAALQRCPVNSETFISIILSSAQKDTHDNDLYLNQPDECSTVSGIAHDSTFYAENILVACRSHSFVSLIVRRLGSRALGGRQWPEAGCWVHLCCLQYRFGSVVRRTLPKKNDRRSCQSASFCQRFLLFTSIGQTQVCT
jgi:hypothetical protein